MLVESMCEVVMKIFTIAERKYNTIFDVKRLRWLVLTRLAIA